MSENPLPRIFIALPVINENELLPELIRCLRSQTFKNFSVFVCVNQPEEWWEITEKNRICENNRKIISFLRDIRDLDMKVIDRASRGKGWRGKKHGVGWARKTVMDAIDQVAGEEDLIVSLDADTTFGPDYLLSVAENFAEHPGAVAMAVPYFHNPAKDPSACRAILRYEIYMRYYSINLRRTGTPFTFTALGSAMVCRTSAYRAIGGMTPKMSGEDFYFLQKLRKYGEILSYNREKVYPAARFSDRVYFGTGPAMIRGNEGDWSSYPVYPDRFFDEVAETISLFPSFFNSTQRTRVVDFISRIFREEDPFMPLRQNFNTVESFIRACHIKFDGLRILQYLKYRMREEPEVDENSLFRWLDRFSLPGELSELKANRENFSFRNSPIPDLEMIRMYLAGKEDELQVSAPLS